LIVRSWNKVVITIVIGGKTLEYKLVYWKYKAKEITIANTIMVHARVSTSSLFEVITVGKV
jgi:hypothetical protein